jgi:hypothetical protein
MAELAGRKNETSFYSVKGLLEEAEGLAIVACALLIPKGSPARHNVRDNHWAE